MNALAFLKLGYPLARQHRAMDEDILAAGHGDETETLLRVVPLDLPVDLFRRPAPAGRPRAGSAVLASTAVISVI
jgi:hypothetical protein